MYSSSSSGDTAGALIGLMFSGVFFIIWLAFLVAVIGGLWKVFIKAGQPGWAAIVPVYNIYILTQIVGRPAWWVLLPFASVIPVLGWIVALGSEIILMNDLSKSYGKDTGFTVGLVLLPPVFIPILGWGQAGYVGPMATGFGLPVTPGGYQSGPGAPGGYQAPYTPPAAPYGQPPAPPAPPAYAPPAPPAPPAYAPPAPPAPPAYAPPAAPQYTPPAPVAEPGPPASAPAQPPVAPPVPPAADAAFTPPTAPAQPAAPEAPTAPESPSE